MIARVHALDDPFPSTHWLQAAWDSMVRGIVCGLCCVRILVGAYVFPRLSHVLHVVIMPRYGYATVNRSSRIMKAAGMVGRRGGGAGGWGAQEWKKLGRKHRKIIQHELLGSA